MSLSAFLKLHGLPERLWQQLGDRVEAGRIGFAGAVQLLPGPCGSAVASRDLAPEADVFLVAHLLTTTRSELPGRLSASEDLVATCRATLSLPAGAPQADVEAAFWRRCKPSVPSADGGQTAETTWHLEGQPLTATLHGAQHANISVVALPKSIAEEVGGGGGGGAATSSCPHGVSMVWVTAPVMKGEPLVRNWLPAQATTLQWAVRLLALIPDPYWWRQPEERASLQTAVQQAAAAAKSLPGFGPPPPGRPHNDPRLGAPSGTPTLPTVPASQLVFTDYPLIAAQLSASQAGWAVTEDRAAAGVCYLVQPQRDFVTGQKAAVLNQFPYEGCLVRKDLLPQTVRQLQFVRNQAASAIDADDYSSGGAGAGRGQHPWWFPEAYDLATEALPFAERHRQLEEASAGGAGGAAVWCVKLAGGARTSDPCVASTSAEVLKYMEAPGGDRVAQLYIGRPLLLAGGRKFDLRCYVVVRSLLPLDAYLHAGFYARLANKRYAGGTSDLWDLESHFSVMRYHADPQKADKQETMTCAAVEADLRAQGYDWDSLLGRMRLALGDLLAGAALTIGSWPHSRGVYGCDIMLAEEEAGRSYPGPAPAGGGRGAVPQLLEVNFSGDLGNACKTYPSFVDDVFATLFGAPGAAALPPSLLKL